MIPVLIAIVVAFFIAGLIWLFVEWTTSEERFLRLCPCYGAWSRVWCLVEVGNTARMCCVR